jgi:hypothetical protein
MSTADLPAPTGWWAFFADPAANEGEPKWYARMVVAWRPTSDGLEAVVWSERHRHLMPASQVGRQLLMVAHDHEILEKDPLDRPCRGNLESEIKRLAQEALGAGGAR